MTLASLEDVDAVVTGAERGLGLAFARALAAGGARVWMISEDADLLHPAVSSVVEEGGKVEFRVVDFGDRADVDALVIDIRAKTPRLEVLGDFGPAPLGRAILLEGLLPGLRRGGGSVVYEESVPLHPGLDSPISFNSVTVPADVLERDAATATAATTATATATPATIAPATAATIGPAIRFVCGLRGEITGRHLELTDLARRLADTGPEALRGALLGPSDPQEEVP